MIVAGEASGDRHAARLVDALRSNAEGRRFDLFGAAGPQMRSAGVEAVVESDELSVVGVAEIGRALPMFLSAFGKLRTAARERRPDVAILVDFPDFNLRLAKSLKKQGLKVVYFISPQLWAWRSYRINAIKKYVDLLLTILPFEKEWYAKRGNERVEFVGNPLANEVGPKLSRDEFLTKHGLDSTEKTIAMLPGSRHKEIVRILPVMLESARAIAAAAAEIQFLVAVRSGRNLADVERLLDEIKPAVNIRVVTDETYDALAAADAAIVTSGTATLETGIIGTPMVIVYKTSVSNYVLLRPLISVEYYGLINLIAGKEVAREMIQYDFKPEAVAIEVLRMLDPEENRRIRDDLAAATAKLGVGGASDRAAEAILRLIDK